MINNLKFRSKCPISCALDVFGDKWSLLIIRDMLFFQKKTFKEFFSSPEKIASNILSSRLKSLKKIGIISKSHSPNNKKTNIYKLTSSGLELIPFFLEITIWSNKNIFGFDNNRSKELNMLVKLPIKIDDSFNFSLKDKQSFINKIENNYLESFNNIL